MRILWGAVLVLACRREPIPPGDDDDDTSGEMACDEIPLEEALLEDGAWDPSFTIAGFSGQDGLVPGVYDLARAPDGSLLAAGRFRHVGAEPVDPLAVRDAGGWRGDLRLVDLGVPEISAVAVSEDGRVALATYTSLPADLLQREGQILVSEDGGPFQVAGSFRGAVRRLLYRGDELWVGGVFEVDGGPGGLAVLGAGGWAEPPGGRLIGLGVYELEADGDGVLVGGSFSVVGGGTALNVAAWDGVAWTAHHLPDATVLALARDPDGSLFAGGLMSVEGSYDVGGLAELTEAGWVSVGGGLANPTFRGVVADLAWFDDALVAAGCFSQAGATDAANVARWTGAAWEALDDGRQPVGSAWFSPLACGDEGPAAVWDAQLQRLLVDGDTLWVGGLFGGVGGVHSQGIIALQDGAWSAQGEEGQGLAGSARALAVGGPECRVHALGDFTHAGGAPATRRILRADPGGWTALGPPLPGGYCWDLAVEAEGVLFAGCDDGYEGIVHRLGGESWQPVGAPFPEGGVAALEADGQRLWVAGGGAEGYLARLDPGAAPNDADFQRVGEFDGRVTAIAVEPAGDGVLVGGVFTEVDGVAARGVARWDGARWEALGGGVAGWVTAVAWAEDGALYASTGDDGTPDRLILGRWDGAAWTEVATPEPGPVPAAYQLYALLARGDHVVAAGFGWPGSGERNLFVYDGSTFESLAGGAAAISVDAVALAADGLWFGGTIAEVGGPPTPMPSVGIARLQAR